MRAGSDQAAGVGETGRPWFAIAEACHGPQAVSVRRTELIEAVAADLGDRKVAEQAVASVLDAVMRTVAYPSGPYRPQPGDWRLARRSNSRRPTLRPLRPARSSKRSPRQARCPRPRRRQRGPRRSQHPSSPPPPRSTRARPPGSRRYHCKTAPVRTTHRPRESSPCRVRPARAGQRRAGSGRGAAVRSHRSDSGPSAHGGTEGARHGPAPTGGRGRLDDPELHRMQARNQRRHAVRSARDWGEWQRSCLPPSAVPGI